MDNSRNNQIYHFLKIIKRNEMNTNNFVDYFILDQDQIIIIKNSNLRKSFNFDIQLE